MLKAQRIPLLVRERCKLNCIFSVDSLVYSFLSLLLSFVGFGLNPVLYLVVFWIRSESLSIIQLYFGLGQDKPIPRLMTQTTARLLADLAGFLNMHN